MIYDDLLPGSGWLNRTTSTQGSFQVSEFIYAPLDKFDHLRWLQSQDNHDNPATSFLQCNMIGCLPRFHLLAEINWSLHHVGSISDFRFLMISVCSRCALYLAVSRKITRFSGCQGHLKRIASSSWRWSCSPPSTSPRTHMIHQGLEGLPSTAKV